MATPIRQLSEARSVPEGNLREMPASVDAERAILGSVIIDNALISQAMDLLKPDDFYVASHRKIFLAMIQIVGLGTEITPILIGEELKRDGDLELVGGVSAISALTYGVPHLSSIVNYAKVVRGKSLLRSLVRVSSRTISEALEENEPPDVILEHAAQWVFDLHRARASTESFRSFRDVAAEAQPIYDAFLRGESRATPTGFAELDKATRGGINPGEIWIVAALTGKGKSAWAMNAARSMAQTQIPVAIISREMSDFENFARVHSALSSVPVWRIRPGFAPSDYQQLSEWRDTITSLPIWINSRTPNVNTIRSQVRELVRREGVRVLFVDYLQLLSTDQQRGMTRTQEVESVSRTLKEIAMDNEIGVIALAQFNRNATANGTAQPELHHLAESSQIERDASVGIILDMEEQRDWSALRKCTMRIAKHRNGPLLKLEYQYNGNTLTFREMGA